MTERFNKKREEGTEMERRGGKEKEKRGRSKLPDPEKTIKVKKREKDSVRISGWKRPLEFNRDKIHIQTSPKEKVNSKKKKQKRLGGCASGEI